jgi:hypothetical protein
MSDVALNESDRDGSLVALPMSESAEPEQTSSIGDHLLEMGLLLAVFIVTGGWVWFLAWIWLRLFGYD